MCSLIQMMFSRNEMHITLHKMFIFDTNPMNYLPPILLKATGKLAYYVANNIKFSRIRYTHT